MLHFNPMKGFNSLSWNDFLPPEITVEGSIVFLQFFMVEEELLVFLISRCCIRRRA